ncbi:MAG: Xaa-Pro peptidase family protein [Methanomicrobiales archaeon]|nr:Xaa-Pro peptidase family protein [Methanomicrobiales archaeon]
MDGLDGALIDRNAAAYVAFGSSADATIRYLTAFSTTDPVVYLKKIGEPGRIIVSQMEYDRAMREAVAVPMTRQEAGYIDYLKTEKDPWRALAKTISSLVQGDILVPPGFPYALGEELRALCRVSIERDVLDGMRAVKSPSELHSITRVQRATESAMDTGISLIRDAVQKDGILYLGEMPLTSEMVKEAIHIHLIRRGCRAMDTIVSCGREAALPHLQGSGPLHAGEPIVLDIFPQDEATGYFADMTRTVFHGEPSSEVRGMYRAVLGAREVAFGAIRAGVSGADVHGLVVDYFRSQGYESNREGFVHNLGHGVGLEVHEGPTLGPSGKILAAGNVVTVEPGLYYRDWGGVRVEDMGVVTEEGFSLITGYRVEPAP